MGHTNYLTPSRPLTPAEFARLSAIVRQLHDAAPCKIRGPLGTGPATFDPDALSFNGCEASGEDYETCWIERSGVPSFCKTGFGRVRPYDPVVLAAYLAWKSIDGAAEVSTDDDRESMAEARQMLASAIERLEASDAPKRPRSLLTTSNPKTDKGRALGYLTAVLHLAPANLSGRNVCPDATPGCVAGCLNLAGRGGIIPRGQTSNAIQRARIARTKWFQTDRSAFLDALRSEIERHVARAARAGLAPAVRLNGTSDLPWERIAPEIFASFPNVQFYDYTKSIKRARTVAALPLNYSLTFSRSEKTDADTVALLLSEGVNVAAVYDECPADFDGTAPVIDGDASDLRFLDPRGVVVALRAKGPAKRDRSGFVIRYACGESILDGQAPTGQEWHGIALDGVRRAR